MRRRKYSCAAVTNISGTSIFTASVEPEAGSMTFVTLSVAIRLSAPSVASNTTAYRCTVLAVTGTEIADRKINSVNNKPRTIS